MKLECEGFFDEVIFGLIKDWECVCGKYKCICYKGIICDCCGVEVICVKVCCECMGYIELKVLVFYIWYFKGILLCMGFILDMSFCVFEEVIYFVVYVVIDLMDILLELKLFFIECEYCEKF